MIIHTVAFRTKHKNGSAEEADFLSAGISLGKLPMVLDFKCYKQTGKKNEYEFGFSMKFESQSDYDAYNNHPQHVSFVQNRWMKEVEDFIELDYEEYTNT